MEKQDYKLLSNISKYTAYIYMLLSIVVIVLAILAGLSGRGSGSEFAAIGLLLIFASGVGVLCIGGLFKLLSMYLNKKSL